MTKALICLTQMGNSGDININSIQNTIVYLILLCNMGVLGT
jgi:hypothetical protein